MDTWVFVGAAALLSVERLCYVWISRAPAAFRAAFDGLDAIAIAEPIDAVRFLFYAFKVLQGLVFIGWCYVHGRGALWPIDAGPAAIVLGAALVAVGQTLSVSVFYRLGRVGVFYGNRFGYHVSWSRGFPFSILAHPQYVGAVLSIWGLFLILRFPNADWFVLPVLETIYYSLGARLEA